MDDRVLQLFILFYKFLPTSPVRKSFWLRSLALNNNSDAISITMQRFNAILLNNCFVRDWSGPLVIPAVFSIGFQLSGFKVPRVFKKKFLIEWKKNNVNQSGVEFLAELGHILEIMSYDTRERSFLFQRLSFTVQRFNAVAFRGCFADECDT